MAFEPVMTIMCGALVQGATLGEQWEHTAHACLVKRGEGEQRGVDRGAVLQQQPHTAQAPGGTGIAQRGAAVDVPCVNLKNIRYDQYTNGQLG